MKESSGLIKYESDLWALDDEAEGVDEEEFCVLELLEFIEGEVVFEKSVVIVIPVGR